MDQTFVKQRALELWNEAQRYQTSGDLQRAIDLYTKSIEIFPTAEAYTFRGWAYSHLNRFEDAIQECKRAIETDPTFGNPYNDIGCYLLIQGKPDDAIDWFNRAKAAPRYEPRHYPFMNLGRAFAAKGMLMRAIHEFQAALEICPGEPVCTAAIAELQKSLH